MKILGIDPGFNGAFALFDSAQKEILFYDVPTVITTASRHEYDIPGILAIFKNDCIAYCILEQSFAMPGQGVISMFSIGKGFGIYLGLLSALRIPFEVVHPKKWQKVCGIVGGKTDGKNNQAYLVASRLFPYVVKDLVTPRGRIIDGRVDALLLVEYGRKTLVGYDN